MDTYEARHITCYGREDRFLEVPPQIACTLKAHVLTRQRPSLRKFLSRHVQTRQTHLRTQKNGATLRMRMAPSMPFRAPSQARNFIPQNARSARAFLPYAFPPSAQSTGRLRRWNETRRARWPHAALNAASTLHSFKLSSAVPTDTSRSFARFPLILPGRRTPPVPHNGSASSVAIPERCSVLASRHHQFPGCEYRTHAHVRTTRAPFECTCVRARL